MHRLLVSVVHRHAPFDEPSSFLYVVDLNHKVVLKRSTFVDPPYRQFELNPRGGSRGCRGLIIEKDKAYISHYSTIFVFDSRWKITGLITHPEMSGIHEILLDDGLLWVTSTSNDRLFSFDAFGNLERVLTFKPGRLGSKVSVRDVGKILLNKSSVFSGRDFRNPGAFNHVAHNRVHINSLGILPNNQTLVSLGRITGLRYYLLQQIQLLLIKVNLWAKFTDLSSGFQKAVLDLRKENIFLEGLRGRALLARISPQGKTTPVIELPNITAPGHSIYPLLNGLYAYLNTTYGSLVQFDPMNGEIHSTTKITEGGFLRGIARISDRLLVVGNLGELILFDFVSNRVLDRFPIVEKEDESVFGIQLLGDEFSLPPEDFRDDQEVVEINSAFGLHKL